MRPIPVAVAAALAIAAVTSGAGAQRPDSQINPKSLALLQEGEAQRAAGNFTASAEMIETALALDPRNRAAYVALARTAQAQGLSGKAIRLYREALALEPNDLAALSGQGEALVSKGAVERAKLNLTRIRSLCKAECAPATTLAAAIAKGPPPAVVAAQSATTVPPKGKEGETRKPE
jgi:Tfp pilus assembly protein PilF